jgi:hypothetical protein
LSREVDFANRMLADAPLMLILTGGVYQRGLLGREGLTRQTAPLAYGADGYLLPAAVVAQRGNVPDGILRDMDMPMASAVQVVEVYLYEDSGYAAIAAAMSRLFALFQGHRFSDSADIYLANVIDRQRDDGPARGASLARMDWAVHSILEVV